MNEWNEKTYILIYIYIYINLCVINRTKPHHSTRNLVQKHTVALESFDLNFESFV